MRRASTLILAAWTAACAGARVPGLPPDATAPIPAAPLPGRLSGAALGWTLGGEAHVFVTDSDFAREVYNTQDPAAKTTPLPRALARRRIVVIDADTVPGHARAAAPSAAMIASTDGAVPALLRLVRVHRGEDCGAAGPVVELVYAITPEALPAAPPAHAVVLALLDAPPSGISRRTPPAALSPADARRLIA
ncbi:MAG TPA: hypothetical protein VFK78_04640, partial [Gemmatimonadales bacterium]|nr:hypothetical protein [Gemmatimonadales bacterium]